MRRHHLLIPFDLSLIIKFQLYLLIVSPQRRQLQLRGPGRNRLVMSVMPYRPPMAKLVGFVVFVLLKITVTFLSVRCVLQSEASCVEY